MPQKQNTIYTILERLIICEPSTLETGCWEWPGALQTAGYAQVKMAGRVYLVHRLVYEHFRGAVPEGEELDHLCNNPICANFEHLEPKDHRANTMRGQGACARNARKTHCPAGHPYSGDNLYVLRGKRYCVTCARARGH
jgi:hypothetical protein